MDEADPGAVGGADLDELYSPPAEMLLRAMTNHLTDYHLDYLKMATFACVATGREGGLDNSPRGGPPGFIRALDRKTIAFGDWPGNNRIETMRNLVEDDRIGLLFIFNGLEIFMRINGRARISTDSALLDTLKEGQRLPRTAIVIAISEVLFHCGKAINRARLWEEDARIDRKTLPSAGVLMKALTQVDELDIAEFNEHYDHAMRNDLY